MSFLDVTELSGDSVTKEQMCNRCCWAGEYCKNKDVVEAACGSGQGLGSLLSHVHSVDLFFHFI